MVKWGCRSATTTLRSSPLVADSSSTSISAFLFGVRKEAFATFKHGYRGRTNHFSQCISSVLVALETQSLVFARSAVLLLALVRVFGWCW